MAHQLRAHRARRALFTSPHATPLDEPLLLDRLARAGEGDSADGYRTYTLGARYAEAYAVTQLSDGHLLLAGRAYGPHYYWVPGGDEGLPSTGIALVRLRADGAPDPAFGDGGRVFTLLEMADGQLVRWMRASGVVALDDGAFLVSGLAHLADGTRAGLVLRYRADGTLDPAFGTGGYVALRVPGPIDTFFDGYASLAVQPDGYIVVAGSVSDGAGDDAIVARFTPGGALDTSFGTQGVTRRDFDGRNDRAAAIVLLPGGGVAVAGRSTDRETNRSDVLLWRLDADGTPVATFGTGGGVRLTSEEGSQGAQGLLAQPDGRLVVSGSRSVDGLAPAHTLLLRVDAAGTVEPGFGTGHAPGLTQRGALYTLTTDAQGRIYGASDYPGAVMRFTSGGVYDEPYARNPHRSALYGVTLDGQGRAVGVGVSEYQSGRAFHAVRLTESGAPDPSFGVDGIARVPIWSGGFYMNRVLAEPDGAAFVAGEITSTYADLALARFTPSGILDDAYGSDGVERLAVGLGSNLEAAARTPDGKLWMVSDCVPVAYSSTFYCDGDDDHVVLRLLPDGSPDPSFNSRGRVFFDFEAAGTQEHWYFDSLAPLADGGALLVGTTYDSNDNEAALLVRLRADGTPDAGFGQNGIVRQPGDGIEFLEALGLSDGSLLVSGSLYDYNSGEERVFLARFSASGALDRTYGQSGLLFLDPFAACEESTILYLRARSGGAEAMVGAGCGNDDDFGLAAVRLDAQGVLTGTPIAYDVAGSGLQGLYNASLDALVWGEDGSLAAAGTVVVRDGFEERLALSVVRLRPDGTPDASWGTNGRVTSLLDGLSVEDVYDLEVQGLVPQPGGTYLVVGHMPWARAPFGFENAEYTEREVFTARVATAGVISATSGDRSLDARALHAAPNPLATGTEVTITLDAPTRVHVAVYDVLGREVAELHRGLVPAGPHRLRWEPGTLPSGLYFVRLQTPTRTAHLALHVVR